LFHDLPSIPIDLRSENLNRRNAIITNIDPNPIHVLSISVGVEKLHDCVPCSVVFTDGVAIRSVNRKLIHKDKQGMKRPSAGWRFNWVDSDQSTASLARANLFSQGGVSLDRLIIQYGEQSRREPQGVKDVHKVLSKRTVSTSRTARSFMNRKKLSMLKHVFVLDRRLPISAENSAAAALLTIAAGADHPYLVHVADMAKHFKKAPRSKQLRCASKKLYYELKVKCDLHFAN
jgi:hypothetical protein